MEKLKNGSLNKITLYQLPLGSQIAYLCSAIGLTFLPIFGIIVLEEKVAALFILLALLAFDVYTFFLVFKTYIRVDFSTNQLIIREFPGFTKMVINLSDVNQMSVYASYPASSKYDYFTFSILHSGGVYHINSWSTGAPLGFILMFNNNRRQVKRLEEFCEKCNQYFNSRQK